MPRNQFQILFKLKQKELNHEKNYVQLINLGEIKVTLSTDNMQESGTQSQPSAKENLTDVFEALRTETPNSYLFERKNSLCSFQKQFGNHLPQNISIADLKTWFRQIQKENNYSLLTLRRIKSNLNNIFKYLIDRDLITTSPLDRIQFKGSDTPVRKRIYYSKLEVEAILADPFQYDATYFYPIVFLAAHTGASRSEILKLKVSDVDFEAKLLHIRNTKTKKDRSIRLNQKLIRFLENQINLKLELLIPSPEGNIVNSQRLTRWMKKFCKQYPRVKHFGLHALRHSFAFNFLKNGGQMYQLKAILSHQTIQMTIDLYGQLQAQEVDIPELYI